MATARCWRTASATLVGLAVAQRFSQFGDAGSVESVGLGLPQHAEPDRRQCVRLLDRSSSAGHRAHLRDAGVQLLMHGLIQHAVRSAVPRTSTRLASFFSSMRSRGVATCAKRMRRLHFERFTDDVMPLHVFGEGMRTRVPARGRLSSNPSISSRSSASETGRKLMRSSAASLRREITCPKRYIATRMRWRTTEYASDARLDCSADSFMGCPAFLPFTITAYRKTPYSAILV